MILSPFRIPLSFKIWGLGFSFMDFILQRRSLIQVLLISLLALILTVSLSGIPDLEALSDSLRECSLRERTRRRVTTFVQA